MSFKNIKLEIRLLKNKIARIFFLKHTRFYNYQYIGQGDKLGVGSGTFLITGTYHYFNISEVKDDLKKRYPYYKEILILNLKEINSLEYSALIS